MAQDGVNKQTYIVTITRNKSVQTLSFPALAAKIYGDADFAPGATSNSQAYPITYISNNAAVATIVNGNVHIVSAGTVNITASQAGDDNYVAAPDITIALTVNPRNIAVTANTQSKIYGSADPIFTYTITSGSLAGTDAFTGGLARDAGETAGNYSIKQGTLALTSNYILTYNTDKLVINPKPITITADAKAKSFGDADPALTYTITGALVGTDTFTGALVRDAGEQAGNYTVKQGTVTLSSNYVLTYVTDKLVINPKAITVTAAAKSKVYGDADPAFTYTISAGALVGTDAFTGALTRAPGANVAGYDILQGTLVLNANYAITYQMAKLTITKKELIVTADDQTRNFGKSNPAFTVNYQGFISGDDAGKLTTLPVVTTIATGTSINGTYPLVPAGGVSVNYSFTYRNGTLSVIPAVNNFQVSNASVTCRGQNNGNISVIAVQPASYTAVVTGNSVNKSYTFNTTLTTDNLAPGTYHFCISDAALPNYQQCYDITITEPKDLAIYTSVNKIQNTVDINLSGGDSYKIKLNGVNYSTSNNVITLPLHKGINQLKVSTGTLCQGVIEKEIDIVDGMIPFPSPFQDVLYINLGNTLVRKGTVNIYNVSVGALQHTEQFVNQIGVIRLNVSELRMGVYSLHLIVDGKETIYKVIKQ